MITTAKKNTQLSLQTLGYLRAHGVNEVCLCPSTRNAPLVMAFQANSEHFKVFMFFEERCASYFALGRIRAHGRPVAVVTTSGTAVAELLPATMEAHYTGTPLILLTADRPRRYRGSGAPQCAEQVGIFGPYVSQMVDLEGPESFAVPEWEKTGPLQMNVCFEEPLLELNQGALPYQMKIQEIKPESAKENGPSLSDLQKEEIHRFFERSAYPIVVLGQLNEEDRSPVLELLLDWGFPVSAESFSGLREEKKLDLIRIYSVEKVFERAHAAGYPVDGIIRMGGIPTLRLWRDLDLEHAALPVLSLSRQSFSGLGRSSTFVQGPLNEICKLLLKREFYKIKKHSRSITEKFHSLDFEISEKISRLLTAEPTSELALFQSLSKQIPAHSRIFIGNSLPVRQWDLASDRINKFHRLCASRGVNGIEGQISTFFGFAEAGQTNWGIVGDLTALYDMPAPWILNQIQKTSIHLVIVNNQGGKIFSRLFTDPVFQNQHSLQFRALAQFWNLDYELWREIPTGLGLGGQKEKKLHRMIEVRPEQAATERFWAQYQIIHAH